MIVNADQSVEITNEDNGKSIKKPNFLIIMVDEQRFPSTYENDNIKEWREKYLKAQNFLRSNGAIFTNHYAASTACAPSRTTLYTGQYPSLHGVTQTDGGGDSAFSPNIFGLDPSTVPTFGDYLRTAGYDTFWKGVNGMHLMLTFLYQVLTTHILAIIVKQECLFLVEKNYI